MKLNRFLLLGAACLISCTTPVAEREREQIATGVYATKDAIDVNRYDFAKEYINETTRLVAPPKKRIKIPALSTPGKKSTKTEAATPQTNYVVLPPNTATQNIIVNDSPEYKQLLVYYTQLQESERKAWETVDQVKKADDKVIQDKQKELDKARARGNIFVRTWHFITGFLKWGTLGFVILLIGALIASAFVPGLLPLIFTVLRAIGVGIGIVFGLITRGISALIDLFQKK